MRVFKILIAVLSLNAIATEYVNVGKQFLNFYHPSTVIISLSIIFVSAWLMGSGLSKEKLPIKSLKFLMFYALALVLFLGMAFVHLAFYQFKPIPLIVNGIEINLGECVNDTKRMIPDTSQRKQYCQCLGTTLAGDQRVVEKHAQELKRGKLLRVMAAVQADASMAGLNLNECMYAVNTFRWTPEFEAGVRDNLLKTLKQSGVDPVFDLNAYCDCLIDGYKQLPVKELSNPSFFESREGKILDSICAVKSRR